MTSKKELLDQVKSFFPRMLDYDNKHKGNCGHIAVVGGSEEYTGAPYFAAISALKTGCDLAHVICPKEISSVIKSFSPDLIVHPWLDQPNLADMFTKWINKFNILVIGPGMGRLPSSEETLVKIVQICKEQRKPLVIDADGLYFVSKKAELFKDYTADLILTPNAMEFSRIGETVLKKTIEPKLIPDEDTIKEIQIWFGHNTIIFHKGQIDYICAKNHVIKGDELGSPRRCGGQGDLLAGALATFFVWGSKKHDSKSCDLPYKLLSCYAASCLIRKCSNIAFNIHGRGMLASDMINLLCLAFKKIFEI